MDVEDFIDTVVNIALSTHFLRDWTRVFRDVRVWTCSSSWHSLALNHRYSKGHGPFISDVAEWLGPYIWAHPYLWANKHMKNCSVSSAIKEMQIEPLCRVGEMA